MDSAALTSADQELMQLVEKHGPLTFSELVAATSLTFSDVNQRIVNLQRRGYFVITGDDRVRLSASGWRRVNEIVTVDPAGEQS